jgi:hypothetical protein
LIFLAFLCPLGLYLIVLGAINRRRHPLLVSGVWDVIGLLFAASGFLLCTGPGLLSSREEGWRRLWLLGETDAANRTAWQQVSVLLTYLYFLVVVGGSALLFWRQRRITSIYNVAPGQLQQALDLVCEKLGLNPVRSGNLLLFGLSLGASPRTGDGMALASPDSYHTPHPPPAPGGITETLAQPVPGSVLESDLGTQAAILEVDTFPFMSHASLRWDPAHSPLRADLEQALSQELARKPTPDRELGGWMMVVGFVFLAVCVFFGLLLFVLHLRLLLGR